ncbi:bifunctional adenosylcobinamide kinase/adenosylcobinamide-phosphate guanylyltransferase [Nakamurella silvestris]|nr:bifunctional adenosylcobinamide kinase/adenosylcobinamide-phosphate guanylyltransferase [Nakamurella silvestris]
MGASTRVLVTGGVRSGKSRHAEELLAGTESVTYIAPGPVPDPVADPDWADRIAQHQARRPAHWATVETADVAAAVRNARGAVLIDCLGTWVTRLFDDLDAWEQPRTAWQADVDTAIDGLADAWTAFDGLAVAVTNEVGMGVVPEHRSGRVFRDVLGLVNQRIAAVSDRVDLVIAGRVLSL